MKLLTIQLPTLTKFIRYKILSLKYPGRNSAMMKFEIKNPLYSYYTYDKTSSDLIGLGTSFGICLRKEQNKSNSYCYQNDNHFNYLQCQKVNFFQILMEMRTIYTKTISCDSNELINGMILSSF